MKPFSTLSFGKKLDLKRKSDRGVVTPPPLGQTRDTLAFVQLDYQDKAFKSPLAHS